MYIYIHIEKTIYIQDFPYILHIYIYIYIYIYTGFFPLGGMGESRPPPATNLLIPSPPRKVSP